MLNIGMYMEWNEVLPWVIHEARYFVHKRERGASTDYYCYI